MASNITETARMQWPFMQWNADWQAWQQKFQDLVQAQDASVFGNLEGRNNLYKNVPNAEIIDDGGVKKLHVASDLVLVSRTLNVAITVDMSTDLVLETNNIIAAVVTPGAVEPQDTAFELYSEMPRDPSIKVFGYVGEDYDIFWYNGARLQHGEAARPIFSFLVSAGVETNKVAATSGDTTPDYLRSKIQSSDGSVVFTTVNAGANEKVNLSVPGVGTDEKAKVSAADAATGYLADKMRGRAGVVISTEDTGGGFLVSDFRYGDDHTIMVERGANSVISGNNLVAAYEAAKLLSLDEYSRAKIELLAGEYVTPSTFAFDTDFIDIVCAEESDRKSKRDSPGGSTAAFQSGGATISPDVAGVTGSLVTAESVLFRGINFGTSGVGFAGVDMNCTGVNKGRDVIFKGCSFYGDIGVKFLSDFNGQFYNCHSLSEVGDGAFVFGGTAIDCSALVLFSNELNGAFIRGCDGGVYSFAGSNTTPADVTDTVIWDCQNFSDDGFCTGNFVSGLMKNCMNWGSGDGFGTEGSGFYSQAWLWGCYANRLTTPIGANAATSNHGWNGAMLYCAFKANGTQEVVHTGTAFQFIGCHFTCDAGRQVGSYSVRGSSQVVSSGSGDVSGCYFENSMGPLSYLSEGLLRNGTNEMPPAYWESEINIADTHDDSNNGAGLLQAFEYAKVMYPHGDAKSATNRITIRLPAANMRITSVQQLTSDYDFIDVIGVGVAGKHHWDECPDAVDVYAPQTHIFADSAGVVLFRTSGASDMKWSNIHFESQAVAGAEACFQVGSTGTPDINELPNFVFENCVFGITVRTASITGITQANPAVVTVDASINVLDFGTLRVEGVGGMTELEDGMYLVRKTDVAEFELMGVDSTDYSVYTSGGTVSLGNSGQNQCIWTEGLSVAAKFRNCHFIGRVTMNGGSFKCDCIDCSFLHESFSFGLDGALFDNCRFAEYSLASMGSQTVQGSTFRNIKQWGGHGIGYASNSGENNVIDDFEFFGVFFLGHISNGFNFNGHRIRATRFNKSIIGLKDKTTLSHCTIKQNDPDSTKPMFASYGGDSSNVTAMSAIIPPSTGVCGIVEFTVGAALELDVGDRIVCCNFTSSIPEMEGMALEVVEVTSSTVFRVELEYASHWPSFSSSGQNVGRVGAKITDCDLSREISHCYIPQNNGDFFERRAAPGWALTLRGNTFSPALAPLSNDDPNMMKLVDCNSYDNNLFIPYRGESEFRINQDTLATVSSSERGSLLLAAFVYFSSMYPGALSRSPDNRLVVLIGGYRFDLSKLGTYWGQIEMLGTEQYITIIGEGSWKASSNELSRDSSKHSFVPNATRIIGHADGSLFRMDTHYVTWENITFENISDVPGAPTVKLEDAEGCGFRNCAFIATPSETYITGITQASPAVVTCGSGHSLTDGACINLGYISGMTELNDRYFIVRNPTATTFELQNIDSTGYTAYSSGGIVYHRSDAFLFAGPNTGASIERCFFNGDVRIDSAVPYLADSTINDCVVLGNFMGGAFSRCVLDGLNVVGRGICVDGGKSFDAQSILRRSVFGYDTFMNGCSIYGVVEDCIGYENFISFSGPPIAGRLVRVKSLGVYDDVTTDFGNSADALIEDCEFVIMVQKNVFKVYGSGSTAPSIRRLTVLDPGEKMVSGTNNSIVGNSTEARISFSELRLGISGVTNILIPTGYNITT